MKIRSNDGVAPVRRRVCLALGLGAGLWPWTSSRAAPAISAPLLAQSWREGADPAGWLVSEKYDGVRALWDGQRLCFRSGREVAAPGGFLARLPRLPLDGELWLARGGFEALSGLVRRTDPDDAAWRKVRYLVFELPGASGTFAQRASLLAELAARTGWSQLQAVEQATVADAAALQRRLDAVVRAGGEGLMLHRADAGVVSGRSAVLCKLKPLQDAEAVVEAHLGGRGRYVGQLGALQVRGDDGVRLRIGSGLSDVVRALPPAIGQRITYTYRGLTERGVPRFASYLRPAPEF